MDRRESLKSLLLGGVGIAGLSTGIASCKTDEKGNEIINDKLYGRTPKEIKHDENIKSEICLTPSELETIAVLSDLILPASPTAGGAVDAGVPDFIEFIIKDLPTHQLPIQGGLMWLQSESNQRFNNRFDDLTEEQQKTILDDIAYPDTEMENPQFEPGRKFFGRLRNLVLTGYYTTKMGLEDLGYVGNRPNLWDGPPSEVLEKHGFAYDDELLSKYVDHDKREIQAKWDEAGNLIS